MLNKTFFVSSCYKEDFYHISTRLSANERAEFTKLLNITTFSDFSVADCRAGYFLESEHSSKINKSTVRNVYTSLYVYGREVI